MTLVFEDDFAVTIKAAPFADRYQLGPDLAKYGSYRTEASSLRRWVGFGVVAGSGGGVGGNSGTDPEIPVLRNFGVRP